MRTALVFGASGQIGLPLLELLRDGGWRVVAVSRRAREDRPGLQWRRGDLSADDAGPADADAIVSCGPLDRFADWYARTAPRAPRVIAFGSTSIDAKRDSADAEERALVERLRTGERTLFDAATARGAAATVLRPTLVYGRGADRNLTRIAAIARRFGRVVLPRDAAGLRQPVHADDLARAAFDALDAPAAHGRAYALPGGETLPYREMVARVCAALEPPARLHAWPSPLFDAALAVARAAGVARGFNAAAVRRMRTDLVFDGSGAQRDFGYAPRPFRPTAAMFDAAD